MFRRFLHDFCRNSRGAVTTCMFSLWYVGDDPLMSSDMCCSTLQNERQTDAQKHSNITYLAQNFWTSQKSSRVESIEYYPYMTKLFRASNFAEKISTSFISCPFAFVQRPASGSVCKLGEGQIGFVTASLRCVHGVCVATLFG